MVRKKLRPLPRSASQKKDMIMSEQGLGASGEKLQAKAVTFGGLALLDAFNKLDEDGNHKISADEMIRGLTKFGKCVSEEEAREIAGKMSPDWKDAKELDFEQFSRSVLEWGLRFVTCT